MGLLILERREGGEQGETLIIKRPLPGDWNLNLGICYDWESNLQPFGLWNDAPTNWATLARATWYFLNPSSVPSL